MTTTLALLNAGAAGFSLRAAMERVYQGDALRASLLVAACAVNIAYAIHWSRRAA